MDVYQLVPGGLAHNAVGRQIEDALEGGHRGPGVLPENSGGGGNLGDSRVVLGYPVEHGLNNDHVPSHGAQAQGCAGVGVGEVLNGGVHHQLDVVPIVVAQDLHGICPLLGQLLAAPLGQAVAGGGGAVAELGGQGLHKALAADIVVKNLVHHLADVLKDVTSPNKFLVVLGGGGDLKIIAPAGVKFRIYSVQGEGDDGQYIGPDGGGLPGGVYLAGGHVFHIVGKGDGDVLRPLVGQAHMHRDGAGHIWKDIQHGATSQVLDRDVPLVPLLKTAQSLGQGDQFHVLHRLHPGKDLHVLHLEHGIPRLLRPHAAQGAGGAVTGQAVGGGALRRDGGVDLYGVDFSAAVSTLYGEQFPFALLPRRGHHHGGPLQGNLRLGGVHPDA